jgi:hypothetical protein
MAVGQPSSGPSVGVAVHHGLMNQPAQNRGSRDDLIAEHVLLNGENFSKCLQGNKLITFPA